MGQVEVLVSELLAVDGLAARAVAIREVAPLELRALEAGQSPGLGCRGRIRTSVLLAASWGRVWVWVRLWVRRRAEPRDIAISRSRGRELELTWYRVGRVWWPRQGGVQERWRRTMKFGMTRWNLLSLYPKPREPEHSSLKFATVFGTCLSKRPIVICATRAGGGASLAWPQPKDRQRSPAQKPHRRC